MNKLLSILTSLLLVAAPCLPQTVISGGPGGHVNSQTSSYTLNAGDCGNIVTENGASLTLTLASPPPSATCRVTLLNLNATPLIISRNGLTVNGLAANPQQLAQYQNIDVWATADGANWQASQAVANSSLPGQGVWWGTINMTAVSASNAGMGSANETRVCGWILPVPSVVTTLFYDINTQSGNMDIGLYDQLKNKIVDTGAIATPTGGVHSNTVVQGTTYLPAGFYYTAFTFDNSTAKIVTTQNGSAIASAATQYCGVAANSSTAALLPATLGTITPNSNVTYPQVFAQP
jgi:hypothetical protein